MAGAGQAFQFTPGGIEPVVVGNLLDVVQRPVTASDSDFAPAALPKKPQAPAKTAPTPELKRAESPTPSAIEQALTPRDVLKLARARIKEIKAELRRHAALKKELEQLSRLVDAAKGRRVASVRNIESARRHG